MGWLWSSSSNEDPTKQLDAGLKDFLDHESPAKYTPTTKVPSPSPRSSSSDSGGVPGAGPSSTATDSEPRVPSSSLFPDGRYAHLWKNYKPLAETEGVGLSPAEKVIEKHRTRRDLMHRAAMENCALEHEMLSLCFHTGDWRQRMKARMTMCQLENREFSRCYTIQAKFLQALGYAATFDWDDGKEERIQMHADKLYHQMLDYEKRVDEAKAAGVEPPPLKALFQPKEPAATGSSTSADQAPAPAAPSTTSLEIPGNKEIPVGLQPSKPLAELTPHERELEIEMFKAERAQGELYLKEVAPVLKADDEARKLRRDKMVSWFGETIGNWIT